MEASEGKKRNNLLVRMAEINSSIEKHIELALTSNDITVAYLKEKSTQLEQERQGVKEALEPLGEAGTANLTSKSLT